MIRRLLALLLILLGVGLFLYPTINDRYESYQQQKILKQWQDNMQVMEQLYGEENEEVHSVTDLNATSVIDGVTSSSDVSTSAVEPMVPASVRPSSVNDMAADVMVTTNSPLVKPKNMEGVLSIAKIDLKLPILSGATIENMKISVASIANTGKAGGIGNYAIAGHRNLTYGKNFNRLDEVAPGDLIEVDTGRNKFTYKIEEKLYVLPTDVWVLQNNGSNKEITLVTCDPMVDPTHRLIVKGKLVE